MEMSDHPKVFISYSHDNDEHKAWVKKLALDLRKYMGVDVKLDQWELRYGSDLGLFMEQGLNEAALVICICSDVYVEKANEGKGGSGYEKMILTADLLQDTDSNYIIPLIRGNKDKKLPRFLGTKYYIDFSYDDMYLEKLGELTARIYNEDIVQKPPLGENPFSQKIKNEITIRTAIEKSAYHNPDMIGNVSFNFKNNSGQFVIGSGDYEFCTRWSECGAKSIYGYKDGGSLIGFNDEIFELPQNKDFTKFDFTSRTREVKIGEVLIWMNNKGKFAATQITDIAVKSRGATSDKLSFAYKIYK